MAYDIIINPVFFKKMIDNPLFHNFFVIATMEGLEEKYDIKLDKNGMVILILNFFIFINKELKFHKNFLISI